MSTYIHYPSTGVFSINGLTGAITLAAGSNVTITPTGNTLTISATGGGGSGVDTIGTIDSETASANGAVITGTSLVLQSGSATVPGLVNLTTQTFAGTKTFANIIDSGLTASTAVIANGSKQLASSATTSTELGYVSGVTSAIQTQIDNKQPLDATLTALAAYNTNGLLTQTAADTFTGRTITGTSNRLSVSNGDGVSANPTLDIDAAYAGQASIITLGTITTGVWSGTAIVVGKGGTGATTLTTHGVLLGQGTSAVTATAAGSAGQVLQSGGASADPGYSTATFPATATGTGTFLRADGTNWVASTLTLPNTTTANQILYSSATSVVGQITTAATSALVTNSSSVPAFTSGGTPNRVLRTDGTTISFAQVAAATDISGTLAVANGGTGATSLTVHGVVIGNTTSAVNVTSAGTAGQVLTSNGASADPTFQSAPAPTAVAFSATGTTTSVSNGNTTTLVNGTEDFDTNSAYDNTTGIFTAPSTGVYIFQASYTSNAAITTVVNDAVLLVFNKNNGGSTWSSRTVQEAVGSSRIALASSSPPIQLSTNDTVRLQLNNASGSTLVGNGNSECFFGGFKIGN